MPLIAYGKDDLDKLCKNVSPSIVSVNIYDNINYGVDFLTGFIIYSDNTGSIICVHNLVLELFSKFYVHFNDGTTERAVVLVEEATADLVILRTESSRHCPRPVVTFSRSEVKREDIFTITEVEGGYSGFNFLRGTVIAPCCEALLDENSEEIVPESTHKFALSCPVKGQVLGAGVFDMEEGFLVGVIISEDASSHRLKFALQACHLVDELEGSLKDLGDNKYSLSKKFKSKVTPCETKKRKLEALFNDCEKKIPAVSGHEGHVK